MSTAQNELLHAIVSLLPAHTETEADEIRAAVDVAFPLDEPPAELTATEDQAPAGDTTAPAATSTKKA